MPPLEWRLQLLFRLPLVSSSFLDLCLGSHTAPEEDGRASSLALLAAPCLRPASSTATTENPSRNGEKALVGGSWAASYVKWPARVFTRLNIRRRFVHLVSGGQRGLLVGESSNGPSLLFWKSLAVNSSRMEAVVVPLLPSYMGSEDPAPKIKD